MAKVAICMAMDIIYTVLLIRLGSNSLYRSTNCSSLQKLSVKIFVRGIIKCFKSYIFERHAPFIILSFYLGGLLFCASL